MGSLFSANIPAPPPPPPAPAPPPMFANPIDAASGNAAALAARAASGQVPGFSNTVETGPQGAGGGSTGKQSLGA
jgi:hypothetical protein